MQYNFVPPSSSSGEPMPHPPSRHWLRRWNTDFYQSKHFIQHSSTMLATVLKWLLSLVTKTPKRTRRTECLVWNEPLINHSNLSVYTTFSLRSLMMTSSLFNSWKGFGSPMWCYNIVILAVSLKYSTSGLTCGSWKLTAFPKGLLICRNRTGT